MNHKRIKNFYDYKNGENITDMSYTELKGDISVMAVKKQVEGKAGELVCIKCQKSKQLWNIIYKITDNVKLILKQCCYDCYNNHTWMYETEDRLYVKDKYGKTEGKLTIQKHPPQHLHYEKNGDPLQYLQCTNCKNNLQKIYSITFDKPFMCGKPSKLIRYFNRHIGQFLLFSLLSVGFLGIFLEHGNYRPQITELNDYCHKCLINIVTRLQKPHDYPKQQREVNKIERPYKGESILN